MGKLIAIEGIDGSGKGTLAKTLAELLRRDGQTVSVIRYPRYRSGPFGRMIGAYLNGKGCGFEQEPYAIASLYALDRRDGLPSLETCHAQDDWVILDRYIASNVAYQCARLSAQCCDDPAARDLADWIIDYEVCRLGLPVPDLSFYLDSPVEVSGKLIARKGGREYTELEKDRNEADTDLLAGANLWYRWLVSQETRLGPWRHLPITDGDGLKPPREIAERAKACLG